MIYKDYGNAYTVYLLIFPDDKKYVGLTRQKPEKRWRCGQGYKHQTVVYNAIQEAGGWDNVKHEIVLENVSIDTGKEKEKELIKQYQTQDPDYGYNVKNGGQTFGEHSQEFLDALHERMVGNTYCIGRKISKKHLQALIEGNKRCKKPRTRNWVMPEEQRKHISECAKERWKNPEYRRKYSENRPDVSGENNPMYGKKHSEETKEKIRQKALGRKLTVEQRKKLSDASTNTKRVFQIDLNGNIVAEYKRVKDAAEAMSCCPTNISHCCRGKGKTCKGFMWRYADDLT